MERPPLPPRLRILDGQLEIESLLGRDPLCLSYRALDSDGQPLTLRELFPTGARRNGLAVQLPDSQRAAFRRLGESLAALEVEGLPRVRAVVDHRDGSFHLREFLEGQPASPPLEGFQAMAAVLRVAQAAQALEQAGWAADVSAERVLLGSDGAWLLGPSSLEGPTAPTGKALGQLLHWLLSGHPRRKEKPLEQLCPGLPRRLYWAAQLDLGQAADFLAILTQASGPVSRPRPPARDPGPPGKPVLEGHRGWVRTVSFSPDGLTLVSGSEDKTLRLWDWSNGQERSQIPGPHGWIWSTAFSADGRLLACGSQSGQVLVLSWPDLEIQGRYAVGSPALSLAFSPGGPLLAIGTRAGEVRLLPLEGSGQPYQLEPREGPVGCLAFSPDGSMLAMGTGDDYLRLWELQRARQLEKRRGHQGVIRCLAFLPDGRLISGSADRSVRVWDLEQGSPRVLGEHHGTVWSVAVHPEGAFVASASADKSLRLWPLDGGPGRLLGSHRGEVTSVALSPGGGWAASSGQDDCLRLWPTG